MSRNTPDDWKDNPYSGSYPSSHAADASLPYGHTATETLQLATLLQRFLGALIDSLFQFALMIPGIVLMIVGMVMAIEEEQRTGGPAQLSTVFIAGVGILVFSGVLVFGIQIFLLAARSQTVGKYMMQTQIVDFETGQPADWIHTIILRIFVNGVLGAIPCVGFIYSMADILFVFRDDRRCIHDLLASTTVIDISNR